MTHRATLVLSLCLSLLIPLGARAQSSAVPAPAPTTPVEPAAPATSEPASSAAKPVSPATGSKPQEAASAPASTPPAPTSAAPAPDATAPSAASDDSLTAQPAVEPPPSVEEAPPLIEPSGQTPGAPAATASLSAQTSDVAKTEGKEVDAERCAQLMAQGNSALAQAEGCGGGDTPIFAGSIVTLSQTGAPASRSLPDADNRFAALSIYIAPRLRLTETWALIADTTAAYEQTVPDDTSSRHEVWWTDPRLTAIGNLGSLGGFSFAGGPRVIVPVSRTSRSANAVLGTGVTLNIVRPLDVLGGLAFVVGGSYAHTFYSETRRTVTGDDANGEQCDDVTGSAVSCPVAGGAAVQDALRATGIVNLNVNEKWSVQAAYLHGWNHAQKLNDVSDSLPGVISNDSPVEETDATRWRRIGSLSLTVNYQPTDWVIASVGGNTSVCYSSDSGGQSAFSGCSGGSKSSDFWLKNPIVNKFSTVSLSFTIPIDAVYLRIKNREGQEKQATARAKREATKL